MSIVLNDNLKIEAPKLIDERFGPHADLTAALAFITPALREMGLIFFVKDGSNLLEYWWPTTDLSNSGIALRSYQPLDADLTAIANISDGSTGFLKKTAANTWSLDTTVVTASTIAGGELEGFYPNPTLKNISVINKVLSGFNTVGGGTIVDGDSIIVAFGKVQNQLNALYGGMQFIDFWNATTNTPSIPAASLANKGNYYIVQVAGSTNIGGITDWRVGDWLVSNGSVWSKIDNTDAVISVNGYTGAVELITDDIDEGVTNLYYTDTRSRLALSSSATGLTYNNGSGVFTLTAGYVIPTTTQLATYVPYTGATQAVDLGLYSIKASNFILGGATGNTGLYYGHTDRVVLANYTAGGIDFETNGGNITMTLFPSGGLYIGVSGVDNGYKLQVAGNVFSEGYLNAVGNNILNSTSGYTSIGPSAGSNHRLNVSGNANIINTSTVSNTSLYSIMSSQVLNGGSFNNTVELFYAGSVGQLSVGTTGTFTVFARSPIGASVGRVYIQGSGSLNRVNAVYGDMLFSSGMSITDAASLSSGVPYQQSGQTTYTGTITNYYGLYLGDVAGTSDIAARITNKFGIRQVGASNLNVFDSSITALSFIKSGGLSTQFLKADGSVDSNTYLTSAALTAYYTATQIQNFFSGASAITGYNKSNWDTAFSWGNHAGLYVNLTGNQTVAGIKTYSSAQVFNNAFTVVANSGAYAQYIQGRASDNYAILGFYSNTGVTRYGYLQSHSAYGGTLALASDGGGRIDLDNRGLTVTGVASFNSSVTATSFVGAGVSLTSVPSNAALYPTFNQNTTGNAATATTASNSNQFGGIGYGGGYTSGTIGNVMIYNSTSARWEAGSPGNIQSFLGLGSYAYRSSGLAELSGATFTGAISATNFSGSSSGTNTGDNAINTLYSGLVSNATHTGDATGATALTVVAIRSVSIPTLAAGNLRYNGSAWVFDNTSYITSAVTSISGTGTVSGLTLTGTVTSTGSLTLGGTLALTAANVNAVGAITNNTSGTAASLSAVLASSLGGAGATNGILKANGSGVVSAAVAGTDYVAPSALSGYLPLSGGTLTGNLSGTNYAVTARSTSNSYQMPDWRIYNTAGGNLAFNDFTADRMSISLSTLSLGVALNGTSAAFSSTLGVSGLSTLAGVSLTSHLVANNWNVTGVTTLGAVTGTFSGAVTGASAAFSGAGSFLGNLGVGTASPAEILHLQSSQPVIRYTKTGILNWYVGNISGNNFTINTDASSGDEFTITSTGNILMKTTTNNGVDALQVAGSGLFTQGLKITNGNAYNELFFDGNDFTNVLSNTTGGFQIGISNASSTGTFRILTANAERLVIDNTGAATFSSSVNATAFTSSSRTLVYGGGIRDISGTGNDMGIAFSSTGLLSTNGGGTATVKDFGGSSNRWGTVYAQAGDFSSSVTATSFSGAGTNLTGYASGFGVAYSNQVASLGSYLWLASALPNDFSLSLTHSFVGPAEGWPNYGSVMNMRSYSGGGSALQMYVPYSPTYGGTRMAVRFGNYDVSTGNSWTGWKYLLSDATDPYAYNMNQYVRTTDAVTFNTVTATNFYGNASSATLVTHLSGRTDGTFYNVIWGAGSPSYLYSCDAVQIRSSDGRLKASSFESTGDIYLGTRSTWLSSWLNQAVLTTSNVTFNTVYAAGNITAYSDIRLKTDIQAITDPIQKLMMLKGFTYSRTDIEDKAKRYIGLSAQDVLAAGLSEAVEVNEKGMYSVAYGNLAAGLLVEVGKNHEERIQDLERKLLAYEHKYGKLD